MGSEKLSKYQRVHCLRVTRDKVWLGHKFFRTIRTRLTKILTTMESC